MLMPMFSLLVKNHPLLKPIEFTDVDFEKITQGRVERKRVGF